MFKRILLPLDGSPLAECVLPHALVLARTHQAQVHLLRVINPASIESPINAGDPFEWNFRKVEAEIYLKNVAARFIEAGLETQTFTAEGKTADTIIEYARTNAVELILLSSHGKSGLTGWNVSSVVQKVIIQAHTSIMLVRAYQPHADVTHYKRILLPLDGSQRAESVLPLAAEMARFWEAELIIVHGIAQPEMPRRKPLTVEEVKLAEKLVECNRAEATQYLGELKQRFDVPLETHLFVTDKIASSLHRFVKDQDIDLVILTAHGFSGEPFWPYGSIVTTFISYGTSPLLVYQDMPPEHMQTTLAQEAAKERGDH